MAARMAMVMVNLPEGCSRLAGGLRGRMTIRQPSAMSCFTCAPAFSVPSRPAWDAGPTAPATHRAAGASASARSWRRRSPWPPVAFLRPPWLARSAASSATASSATHPRPGSCRPRCAHPSCRHEWSSPRQRTHPRWPRRGVAAETANPAHPTNWREACPPRCSGTDVAPPERRTKGAVRLPDDKASLPRATACRRALARIHGCRSRPLGMSGLASAVRGRSADQKPRRPSGASERQGRDAVAGPGARIPSDSRHLLGLGQALLRRGKQMSGRTHGEPRATRVTHGVATGPQTPALLWCRCSGHGGLRSSATPANGRLRTSC